MLPGQTNPPMICSAASHFGHTVAMVALDTGGQELDSLFPHVPVPLYCGDTEGVAVLDLGGDGSTEEHQTALCERPVRFQVEWDLTAAMDTIFVRPP